jgi:hypothetical protein
VWLPVLCLVALLWSCAAHADFEYTEFVDVGDGTIAGMALNRSTPEFAVPTGAPDNRLRITQNGVGDDRGTAWHNTKQVLTNGFETTFTYKYTNLDGDGIAFVIQNSPDGTAAIGTTIDGGGGKGFAGIPNSLAIEIDAYASHFAVHSMGTAINRHNHPTSELGLTAFSFDNDVHIAKITYYAVGATRTLRVFHDDMDTPVLTVSYDLSAIGLDAGAAYLGFSGATGGASETADILDWAFSNTDTTPPDNPIVWSPSHVVTWPVNDDTIIVNWTGATDNMTGVDAYSFVFDTIPGTVPDTTIDLDHTTDPHGMTYGSLTEDTYYFHLRTCDNADLWSDATHYGPMIVNFDPPGAPIGAPLALGLLVAAVAVAGARLVRRRP